MNDLCSPRPCEVPKLRPWNKWRRFTICQWCENMFVRKNDDGYYWKQLGPQKLVRERKFGFEVFEEEVEVELDEEDDD